MALWKSFLKETERTDLFEFFQEQKMEDDLSSRFDVLRRAMNGETISVNEAKCLLTYGLMLDHSWLEEDYGYYLWSDVPEIQFWIEKFQITEFDDLLFLKELGGVELINWWFRLAVSCEQKLLHTNSFMEEVYEGFVDYVDLMEAGVSAGLLADFIETRELLLYWQEFLDHGLDLAILQLTYNHKLDVDEDAEWPAWERPKRDLIYELLGLLGWEELEQLSEAGINVRAQEILEEIDLADSLPHIDFLRTQEADLKKAIESKLMSIYWKEIRDNIEQLRSLTKVNYQKWCDYLIANTDEDLGDTSEFFDYEVLWLIRNGAELGEDVDAGFRELMSDYLRNAS